MPTVQAIITLLSQAARDTIREGKIPSRELTLVTLFTLRRCSSSSGHQNGFPELCPDLELSRGQTANDADWPQHWLIYPRSLAAGQRLSSLGAGQKGGNPRENKRGGW
jgi:hypothetical protein